MKTIRDEPAIPVLFKNMQKGLTIRQEFAARFMAAMLDVETPSPKFGIVAKDAVEAADALINALNSEE